MHRHPPSDAYTNGTDFCLLSAASVAPDTNPTFRAPRFTGTTLEKPAIVTVMHNGVVVHASDEFWGPTSHKLNPPYAPSNAKGYIGLQDHGNPVRFRNIWIRALKDAE